MSGTATGLRAQFPSGPLLDAAGEMFPVWRAYFAQLYVRTGGAVGASSGQIQADLDAEEAARQAADLALTTGLAAERTAREAADTAEAAARAEADAKLLPLAGGTMTGTGMITLSAGAPTNPRHAVGKGYVDSAVSGVGGVDSFNTRTGAVTLLAADITGAGGALLASPVFTGNPQVPTATVGDADTTAASTAFVATAVAGTHGNVGRNLLHNAAFVVQQRGMGGWAVNGYTADRWLLGFGGGTATVQILAAGDPDRAQIGDESATSMLRIVFVGGAAAGDATQIMQRIEDVRRLAGVTATLSFWARVISGGPALGISITQNFGGGGSVPVNLLVGTATLAATWQRFSFQRVMPTASGKTFGTAGTDHIQLAFNPSSGSTNAATLGVGVQSGTFDIWGVQLEIGSVATPLERIEYVDDLLHCRRFYQIGQVAFAGYGTASMGMYASGNLIVPMRAPPSIALLSNGCSNCAFTGFGGIRDGVIAGATTGAAGTFTLNVDYTVSADL